MSILLFVLINRFKAKDYDKVEQLLSLFKSAEEFRKSYALFNKYGKKDERLSSARIALDNFDLLYAKFKEYEAKGIIDNVRYVLSIQNYLKTHMLKKYTLKKNQFFLKLIEDDLYNTIIVLAKQMQHGLFELSACEERVYDKIQDIELKGFIDRVDLYQNYLKVIDYKSSNKELNLELARLGFNMQMLIYLEMLSKNKNYDKGAVLYFNTKKRMLKSEISILEKQDP